MFARLNHLVYERAHEREGGRLVESGIALLLVLGLVAFSWVGVQGLSPLVATFGALLY